MSLAGSRRGPQRIARARRKWLPGVLRTQNSSPARADVWNRRSGPWHRRNGPVHSDVLLEPILWDRPP